MSNLANTLLAAAQAYPNRPAVRQDDVVLSYADLDAKAASVAAFVRQRGVVPGDRVGLMLPNVATFPVLYFGLLRTGAVVVPINPLLTRREVDHYVTDSGMKLIFAWHEARGADDAAADVIVVGLDVDQFSGIGADTVEPRDDDDTAVILYTSGTTGTPKGAELTHANLRTNAAVTAQSLLNLGPDDMIMGCLPLFHVFGQTCGLNAAVASGACITLLPRFDPAKVVHIVERDGVTVFEGVPTMYVALLAQSSAGTASLRVCVSGGAGLPVEVLHEFEARFGCEILEGYGLSETSPVACFNQAGARKPGSIGVPIDDVSLRVIDANGAELPVGEVGEIAIRGHNVMKGYWDRPDATAEAIQDGWFRSGDLGRTDSEGYFYIVDRKKDLIIRGGYNVYPREVEEVLYEHPHIIEAAVIGVPHPTHGEDVAAAIVVSPGATVTADDVQAFVKERVAPYKYPRHVWLMDALPKGPTGKILKREITLPQAF